MWTYRGLAFEPMHLFLQGLDSLEFGRLMTALHEARDATTYAVLGEYIGH